MILFNIKHLISGQFGTHNIKEQFGTETVWDQDCMGCMSVGVYIDIVYITPTTRGICVLCLVSLGFVCQLVFTLVLYISCQQLGEYV